MKRWLGASSRLKLLGETMACLLLWIAERNLWCCLVPCCGLWSGPGGPGFRRTGLWAPSLAMPRKNMDRARACASSPESMAVYYFYGLRSEVGPETPCYERWPLAGCIWIPRSKCTS
jgi:hypothetical protein